MPFDATPGPSSERYVPEPNRGFGGSLFRMSGISSTARPRPGRLVLLLVLLALLGCLFVWVQARRRHAAEERLRHASLEALQTLAQSEPGNAQIQLQIGNRWM